MITVIDSWRLMSRWKKVNRMLCKDCPHFHIDYPPIKNIDFGRASCDKYDLITDFIDMKKFETLKCVEEEGEQE